MRTHVLRWLLGLVILLSGWTAPQVHAQRAARAMSIDPADYVHTVWGTNDGLPQTSVNAILQTTDGYLWLGTGGGLVRFDGLTFTVFNTANTPALTSNRILSLYEDHEGTLWIGTVRGGLVRYRAHVFEQLLPGQNAYAFIEDRRQRLWVGVNEAIVRITPSDTTIIPVTHDQSFDVYGFVEANDTTLWVASNRGLHVLQTEEVTPQLRPHPAGFTRSVYTPLRDNQDAIWMMVATPPIYRFSEERVDSLFFGEVTASFRTKSAFVQPSSNVLWLGTTYGLFFVAEGATEVQRFDHPVLNDKNVNAVFVDREGILWVGTQESGIHRFVPRSIHVERPGHGDDDQIILALHEARQGGLWVGTSCDGLFYMTEDERLRQHFEETDGLSNACVWSLLEDYEETLWVGTWGGGLFTVRDGQLSSVVDPRLQSYEAVLALYQSRDSSLWIGTFAQGLVRLKDQQITTYTQASGLASNDVRYIYEARDGSFWIGTTGGLSHLQADTIVSYTTADGLGSNFVRAIYEDAEGMLWIGTYGGGLSRFHQGAFVTITEADGLYDNTISRIFADEAGHFWMTGNKGITRVHRDVLNDVANGAVAKVFAGYYTESAGMVSRETNGGFQPAGWQRTDGSLWIPTQQGIAVVDPMRAHINSIPPPIAIEQIVVNDTNVFGPLQQTLHLDARQRNLNVAYTGLSFVEPEKVLFRYRLEPFDEAWHEVGTRREAYYTNLPPGAYTFRVVAINNDGVASTTPATFDFTIARPWWQHPVMYLVYLLAGAGMVMGVFRWRLHRLQRRQEELEQEVDAQVAQIRAQQESLLTLNEQLHEKNDTLASTIEQLSTANTQLTDLNRKLTQLNEEKNAILSISAHDLGNPIATIKGFTEILSEEHDALPPETIEEMLGYITKGVNTMRHIVANLTDLQRLEQGVFIVDLKAFDGVALLRETVAMFHVQAEAKGIVLAYEALTSYALPIIYADSHLVRRIFQNLISNALKFSEAQTRVVVGAKQEGDMVQFWVKDQGPGISESDQHKLFTRYARLSNQPTRNESTTGLGLSIVKAFAELMQGQVWCVSTVGRGSTFYVSLPLAEHADMPFIDNKRPV